jgi:hypothetical protein
MCGLCHHYEVEMHNFASNAILQAATFVGVCEGFLGIPVNWAIWGHLFHTELHTLATAETRVFDLTAGLAQGVLHPLHDDNQQRGVGEGMVLPPQRRAQPPPYIGKALKEKAYFWHHGLSPSSRQDPLESILNALKNLADTGLGAASVLANLHHKWIVPLMERELRIYEMSEAANTTLLARSRLLHDRFPQEYAATRVRHAISLKAGWYSNDEL